jgi:hypothetical protein
MDNGSNIQKNRRIFFLSSPPFHSDVLPSTIRSDVSISMYFTEPRFSIWPVHQILLKKTPDPVKNNYFMYSIIWFIQSLFEHTGITF